MTMSPKASIVITSRNRRDELAKAVASALAQKVEGGVEIIVIDDGSTDGTSEMIAEKFPQVKLHRFETSRGLIVQRNQGAQFATAPIIFSIDDDACFTTENVVADILRQFDRPAIGAVAIPFVNVCQDAGLILQQAPAGGDFFVCPSYIGTAHALRRELFLRLGGYRGALFHQGEEGDYCLRMLDAGCVVRMGRSDPIHHFESPRRDFRRVDLYGRRNNILFGWHNVPSDRLPLYLAATTVNGVRHGLRVGRPMVMLQGLGEGYRAIWQERKQRAPVSAKAFNLYRELVRRHTVPYAEIESRLQKSTSIVVAQLGARMHYAVPRILERAGLLEHFYTDICAKKGWPRLLRLVPEPLQSARMQRLLSRDPKEIPDRRITAFTNFGFEYVRRFARARSTDERNAAYLWSGREFCRRVVSRGFGQAKAIYVFNSAGLEILQEARRRGLKGIVEQTIAPRAVEREILGKEAASFPGWEAALQEGSLMDEYCKREAAEWAAADLVVCGSEFVREGISASGGPGDRCVVVPYGVEQKALVMARPRRQPGPLRVLTVGAVCLRKGVPYLLAAAQKMGASAEFRMAGAIQILPKAEQQMRRHIQLMGIIPRPEMAAQYAWADVFLLPSLCEGSATVTYEAMFQGLPVICTPQTGSTVRDGVDGFIVASRDPTAIVDKLEIIAAKPDLLVAMSESARQNSAAYTLKKYGERLIAAFRERGVIS